MPKKACFGPEKPVDTSHPVCVLSPKEGGGFRTSCGYDRRPEGPGELAQVGCSKAYRPDKREAYFVRRS